MKKYKKLIKAFGGNCLYFDKTMMEYLDLLHGDEVTIDFTDNSLTITKSNINNDKIQELMNAIR